MRGLVSAHSLHRLSIHLNGALAGVIMQAVNRSVPPWWLRALSRRSRRNRVLPTAGSVEMCCPVKPWPLPELPRGPHMPNTPVFLLCGRGAQSVLSRCGSRRYAHIPGVYQTGVGAWPQLWSYPWHMRQSVRGQRHRGCRRCPTLTPSTCYRHVTGPVRPERPAWTSSTVNQTAVMPG